MHDRAVSCTLAWMELVLTCNCSSWKRNLAGHIGPTAVSSALPSPLLLALLQASSGDNDAAVARTISRPKSASPVAGLPVASRLLAPTQSSLAKARGPVQLDTLPSSASAASVASAAAPKPRLRSLVVVPSPAKAEAAVAPAADAVRSKGVTGAPVSEDKSIRSLRAEVRAKLEAKAARHAKKQQEQELGMKVGLAHVLVVF